MREWPASDPTGARPGPAVQCPRAIRPRQSSDVSMVAVEGEGAAYWPRWRGPGGQAVVDDGHAYVDTWSDTQNVRWRTPARRARPTRRPSCGATTSSSPRRGKADDGCRSSRCVGATAGSSGTSTSPPGPRARPSEEHAGVGHPDDRRRADLRVVRQPGSGGAGPWTAGWCGTSQLGRNRGTTTAQRVRRSCTRIALIVYQDQRGGVVRCRVRRAHRTGEPIWRTSRRGQRGMGHAGGACGWMTTTRSS